MLLTQRMRAGRVQAGRPDRHHRRPRGPLRGRPRLRPAHRHGRAQRRLHRGLADAERQRGRHPLSCIGQQAGMPGPRQRCPMRPLCDRQA